MRPNDTSLAVYRAQLQVYRRMSGEERLMLALDMSDYLRAVTEDGVRVRHPDYDAKSVEAAVLRLTLGESIFQAAFPAQPPVMP